MYGETFQRIRKSKKITLKEAAGDSLSVSQLSRFENGKTMIPTNRFFEVLGNIHTSIQEFLYLQKEGKTSDLKKIGQQIETYTNEENLEELRALIVEIKQTSPSPYSINQFLIYFIECILAIYEEREPEAHQPVLNYLMQVENWGEAELRLYAMFGFALDIETTYFLMRTALKRSQQYLEIPSASKLLFSILANNFSTFLAYDCLDYAEETIELFEKNYARDTDELSPHIEFMFNKGLLAFRKGDPKKAAEHCENAITICNYFKQNKAAKNYQSRYESWKKGYKNPNFKELTIQIGLFETS